MIVKESVPGIADMGTKQTRAVFVGLSLLFILFGNQERRNRKSEASLGEVLVLAINSGNMVFVDAYAEWCAPCKLMDRKIFPNSRSGDFYNQHFVSVRIDMEKGEGRQLRQLYQVKAFPTFLYLNADGILKHKAVGYLAIDGLIEQGERAIDPKRQIIAMDQQYDKGERNKAFLKDYAYASYRAMNGRHAEVASAYLNKEKDWDTPQNLEMIYVFTEDTDSEMFEYLIDHRSKFTEFFGKDRILKKIQALILTKAFKDKTKNEAESLLEVEKLYYRAFPDVAAEMTASFKMNYYKDLGQMDKYIEVAIDHYQQYPTDDPIELNNAAWVIYEHATDKKMLKHALGWAQQSVYSLDAFFNNDTLARIYLKLGKEKLAQKTIKHAIELGKASGEDVSALEALLK